ncbi:MAG: alpha/beta hydrolase [Desulfuromonas sp.]|nr:alpha/beta hydrolase [Desulfuromonas sp.]
MDNPHRLILLPGLAADERMYAHLDKLPIRLITPRLLVPRHQETMSAYALRYIEWLNIDANDVVGGCSFGSMVASEICRQRTTRGLVLLSGALSSAALAPSAQKLKCVSNYIPYAIARRIIMSPFFLRAIFGSSDPEKVALASQMVADTPRELLLRGSRLATEYLGDMVQVALKCDVYALHGGQDRVLSPPKVANCSIITDAGHGMVISHAAQVEEFLRQVLAQLAKA